ncbi:MAG: YgiQ family radical SAM protein [Methanospirillum sp.]
MVLPQPPFLPMSRRELDRLGLEEIDVLLVSGDAYVDHPSFGTAVIGRVLWDAGYTVGVCAQPGPERDDLLALGRPRLFVSVSSGAVDSMVNRYTPNRRRRAEDAYSPGGVPRRPDRAVLVYTDRVHAAFPGVPVVLGGIEASLRRFAHYDYWSDSVRASVLADAPADLLVYGPGERQVVAIAERLDAGEDVRSIRDIRGTMWKCAPKEWRAMDREGIVALPSYGEVAADPAAFAAAHALLAAEQDPCTARPVAQPHPKTVVVQHPSPPPFQPAELDRVYELPYARRQHPSYQSPVPALEPVRFSITTHRGCFGDCSFCAISCHQGRAVQSRTAASIVREAERMARMPEFKGVIQDVGGPSANMYGLSCPRWTTAGACADRRCGPDCPNLQTSAETQLDLLARLRQIPGVKRVFIGSGIRHDLVLAAGPEYLEEVCRHHVSGHLKVAPEHAVDAVCERMHKPGRTVFEAFRAEFEALQRGKEKRQYLVPYLMSGHPGCTVEDMVELAEYLRDEGLYTEQVQDFTPTPMTLATAMYATGLDPCTGEAVHVPKGREKQIQRALLHYRDERNRDLVEEGLRSVGRTDLIGPGRRCLIPARGRERRGMRP